MDEEQPKSLDWTKATKVIVNSPTWVNEISINNNRLELISISFSGIYGKQQRRNEFCFMAVFILQMLSFDKQKLHSYYYLFIYLFILSAAAAAAAFVE